MIKEDYVSFETAKLLKEKGFDEPSRFWYDNNGVISQKYIDATDKPLGKDTHYHCVTISFAMKWLREVHGIHINVFRYPAAFLGDNNEQHKPWWFQYTFLKPINEIDIDSRMTNDELESAEEAMDYAIKYCLENLI